MLTPPVDRHGILLRRDAVLMGFDDNWLHRMVRCGELVRVRHGAYVASSVWRGASRVGRHLLVAEAVMLQYDDRVARSHTSAHLARGGPDWGLDLSMVHITNLYGRGDRTQAGIVHHHGDVSVQDISRLGAHWATAGPRTGVETAALVSLVPAVCVLDWTVHSGHASQFQLLTYAETYMRQWPDTIGLPQAVARVDGRSESVGETRTRLLLQDLGHRPEPQWSIRRPNGTVAGIVDLLLEDEGVMVEFDGMVKYGRLLRPGQTISDVITAERRREMELQEITGLSMLRVVWAELDRADELDARVRRLAAQQLRLRAG